MKNICIIIITALILATTSNPLKAQGNTLNQSSSLLRDSIAGTPIYNNSTTFFDFAGTWNNDSVVLNWTTLTESNTTSFILEKSRDGINWQKLENVAAAGNSNTPVVYYDADTHPFAITYYRIKQADGEGAANYSKVLRVTAKKG